MGRASDLRVVRLLERGGDRTVRPDLARRVLARRRAAPGRRLRRGCRRGRYGRRRRGRLLRRCRLLRRGRRGLLGRRPGSALLDVGQGAAGLAAGPRAGRGEAALATARFPTSTAAGSTCSSSGSARSAARPPPAAGWSRAPTPGSRATGRRGDHLTEVADLAGAVVDGGVGVQDLLPHPVRREPDPVVRRGARRRSWSCRRSSGPRRRSGGRRRRSRRRRRR